MEVYQARVMAEKEDLDAKIDRLQAFIETPKFKDLSTAEQRRMRRQIAIMGLYSDVLDERILAFEE